MTASIWLSAKAKTVTSWKFVLTGDPPSRFEHILMKEQLWMLPLTPWTRAEVPALVAVQLDATGNRVRVVCRDVTVVVRKQDDLQVAQVPHSYVVDLMRKAEVHGCPVHLLTQL